MHYSIEYFQHATWNLKVLEQGRRFLHPVCSVLYFHRSKQSSGTAQLASVSSSVLFSRYSPPLESSWFDLISFDGIGLSIGIRRYPVCVSA